LDEFDELLLRVIDKTVRCIFGETNAGIIYSYLEKKGCALNEIPRKPGAFSAELRNILGSTRGQILGAPSILEEAILEAVCAELKTTFDGSTAASFAEHIKELRQVYDSKRESATRRSLKVGSSGPVRVLAPMPLQKKEGELVARRKDRNHLR
jgi:hypothetical protein